MLVDIEERILQTARGNSEMSSRVYRIVALLGILGNISSAWSSSNDSASATIIDAQLVSIAYSR